MIPSSLPFLFLSLPASRSCQRWAELQGDLRSCSHLRQWAGRGCCPWRRHMCSPPCAVSLLHNYTATKLQKQLGNNTLNSWVPADLHNVKCKIEATISNILITAFIHDGSLSYIIHSSTYCAQVYRFLNFILFLFVIRAFHIYLYIYTYILI